jgi:hypothetical protein
MNPDKFCTKQRFYENRKHVRNRNGFLEAHGKGEINPRRK